MFRVLAPPLSLSQPSPLVASQLAVTHWILVSCSTYINIPYSKWQRIIRLQYHASSYTIQHSRLSKTLTCIFLSYKPLIKLTSNYIVEYDQYLCTHSPPSIFFPLLQLVYTQLSALGPNAVNTAHSLEMYPRPTCTLKRVAGLCMVEPLILLERPLPVSRAQLAHCSEHISFYLF